MVDLVYKSSFLAKCLGLPPNADWSDVVFSLQGSGYRNITPYKDDLVGFRRILAKVEIGDVGSGWYAYFDPALKTTTIVPGIDLNQAMGFEKSSFLSSVNTGATIGSDYVQLINKAIVRNELQNLTTNLINWIEQNNPIAHIEEIIGGRKINTQIENTFFFPSKCIVSNF